VAFGSRTVALRDVQFNVNLASFRTDLGLAKGEYQRTVGAMSTDALKLTTRQYELAKAVERFGAASPQAARKTILLREEIERLGAASTVTSDRLLGEERTMGRFSRGTLAAAGASGELRRALLLGSTAFLGGYGIITGLKQAVDAAQKLQVAQGQLSVSLKDSGLSWGQYGRQINAALEEQVKTTAFTRDELTTVLATNIRTFGNVDQALRANAVAADVARAKNIDLATAQQLIQKAALGQSGSLRQLGINYVKTTANTDALKASTKYASEQQKEAAKAADAQANALGILDAVSRRFHGNAARYLQTTAGKEALFNAELTQSKEIIGQALLPTINHLLDRLSAWLDKMNRTGRLQHDVNKVVHDGGVVFHTVGDIIGKVDKATGGFLHTLELLAAFKFARLVGGWLSALDVLIAKWGAVKKAAIVAQEAEAAPPVGAPVSTTSKAVIAGEGAASFIAPTFAAVLGINALQNLFGSNETELGTLAKPGPLGPQQIVYNDGKLFLRSGRSATPLTPAEAQALLSKQGTKLTGAGRKVLAQVRAGAHAPLSPIDTRHPGQAPAPGRTTGRPPRKPQLILGLTEAQQTALLEAEGTPGTADDVKALDDQLAILDRLLKQPGLNAAQRNALLQQRNSALSQLQSLDTKTASAHKKAETAAEKARRKRITGLESAPLGIQIALKTAEAHNASEKTILGLLEKERAAIERQVVELRKISAGKAAILRARSNEAAIEKQITALRVKKAVDAAANEKEFLAEFSSLVGSYGSNVTTRAGGQVGAGTTVVVNQHFNAPTANRNREATLTRVAMQAAYD
jgi:hypothetical protein